MTRKWVYKVTIKSSKRKVKKNTPILSIFTPRTFSKNQKEYIFIWRGITNQNKTRKNRIKSTNACLVHDDWWTSQKKWIFSLTTRACEYQNRARHFQNILFHFSGRSILSKRQSSNIYNCVVCLFSEHKIKYNVYKKQIISYGFFLYLRATCRLFLADMWHVMQTRILHFSLCRCDTQIKSWFN